MHKGSSSISPPPVVSWLVVLILGIFAMQSVSAAEVRSLSREQYKQYDDEIYWEISITCAGIDEKRIMQQEANGDEWCARDVEGICHSNKMNAAARICSNGYKRALAAQEAQSQQTVQPAIRRAIRPASQQARNSAPAASSELATSNTSNGSNSSSTAVVANAAPQNQAVVVQTPAPTPVIAPQAVAKQNTADENQAESNSQSTTETNPASPVISTPDPQTTAQTETSLLEDQIEIEEQRIKIEQQKLDLRRQELELQKRELELSRQQESS